MDDRESSRMASSDNPAAMLCPNIYTGGTPDNVVVMPSSVGMMHHMHLPFNSMAPCMSKQMELSNSLYCGDGSLGIRLGAGLSMGEPAKKKRGRPRKYGPDGSTVLALFSPASAMAEYSSNPSSEPPLPKRRGRPPGSGKKQQLDSLGIPGIGFTAHIIIVKAGEDVASKIMAFSEQGQCTVCVISAIGCICNATLRQAAVSGGTMTYEGRFEIVSLSGSFVPTENGGIQSRTGVLNVSLAEHGGRVIGGVVVGMLTAATPVQVVVASFMTEGRKSKPDLSKYEPSSVPQVAGCGVTTSPPSCGTSSEPSDNKSSSPLNQLLGSFNNSTLHVPNMSAYTSVSWPDSTNQQWHDGEM